jgi:flagellar biosynthetic protein FliP
MVALMYAGMLMLDPLYDFVAGVAGVSDPWSRLPVLSNLMMAVNMTIPMVLYMLHKRHAWRAIVEMSAAMFLPAALTMGPYLLGAMTTGAMMAISHAAMIPLMVIAAVLDFRKDAHRVHDARHDAENVPTPGSAISAAASS